MSKGHDESFFAFCLFLREISLTVPANSQYMMFYFHPWWNFYGTFSVYHMVCLKYSLAVLSVTTMF